MTQTTSLHRQTCKVCGCKDKFDFHVPETLWQRVVPESHRNQVVCLSCFDEFAYRQGIDYSGEVETLYFAGNAANLIFTRN